METIKQVSSAYHDERGDIFNLFEGRIEHIALVTSKEGSVRGNHYHKEDHQYIYLISGEFESHSCDIRNPSKKQVLKAKSGDLIDTPPSIAHAQKFTKDSVFLALTTCQRESGKYEQDTIAYQVIDGYLNPELKTK